jgi:hypothetical protein
MKSAVSKINVVKLKSLYFKEGRSMLDIGKYFGVSLDAVAYAMRKNNLSRRSLKDASAWSFKNKEMTFKRNKVKGLKKISSEIILAMLYWGEGFKGNENSKATTLDFANSDPEMVRLYIYCLRVLYKFDEKKLRVLLYCYSNQNIPGLIGYWSKLTNIPKEQFSKPYIRTDSRVNARIMKYGLVHIRYHDKKLLLEIKNLIDYVRGKYCAGGGVVNRI